MYHHGEARVHKKQQDKHCSDQQLTGNTYQALQFSRTIAYPAPTPYQTSKKYNGMKPRAQIVDQPIQNECEKSVTAPNATRG
jgi:hypothetical protein